MSNSDGDQGKRGTGTLGCVAIGAALFFLGLLVISAIGYFMLRGLMGDVAVDGESGSAEKIAHIDLVGVISSSSAEGLLFGGSGDSMVDKIKAQLDRAVKDSSVKAIVLRINSPGGEVTASDTIYHAVSKARESKPVVVYMDAVAASGGYYVACGATEIVASETTLTGSIGVIMQSIGYDDLFEKVGVTTRTFKSGEFKDILSGSREVTPRERELIDSLVMEMYDRFVGIVAEARDLPDAKLRAEIADGRVFTGGQAKRVGLVDSTGYIEDAYDRARDLGNAPKAGVIKMNEVGSLFEALGLVKGPLGAGAAVPARIELDVADRLLPRLQPGVPYLLPDFFLP